MKYQIQSKSLILPVIVGVLAGVISANVAVGVAVFAVFLIPPFVRIYIPYAKDNPERLWFKRKLYGWGWTPVTWEGWLVTLVYVLLVIAAALTIDEGSPTKEIIFTFVLPTVLLTGAFIRIACKKGERPKWQWGRDDDKK